MAGDLLNIGKTGLYAAQLGLSTTGHNIANANVAGYSRQVVMQAAMLAQNTGSGFVGSGTQVTEIKRFSDEFLNTQVRSAQASASSLAAYNGQVSQIDNLLADTTSGLSPTLQDFFNSVQSVTGSGGSVPSRQALLSSADALAARFQTLNGRLQEIRDGVNARITTSTTLINSYAHQIADLNEKIGGLGNATGAQPNDLLDARDQLIAELNKQVKTTVMAGANNSVTVSIGSGQPLVVGKKAFELAVTTSPTDLSQIEVGYVNGDKVTPLSSNSLSGGELGGLLDFRANALDRAQNSLGRIAIGLAATINAQHRLGLDSDDQPGADFFRQAEPQVTRNVNNDPTSTTTVAATIVDASALTTSDYKVSYNGSAYTVTRLSDNQPFAIATPGVPQVIDGIEFTVAGAAQAGDNFLVRPSVNGAVDFKLLVADSSKIAAAAPIVTEAPLANTGTGKIGPGSVDQNYLTPGNALTGPVTLTYAAVGTSLSGFPATQAVTVTANGVATTYAAGTATIPYTDGATYSFGGVNLVLSGQPNDLDKFSVAPNSNASADTRNAGLLGDLQTTKVMGGNATYQSAYAELVSFVGNKTREVQVNGAASEALLAQATASQQGVSGVNLDEEAANLLKYQQAYQAAGKVMQIASTLFDTLLTLGR
jgi:flagellar hook-associated protein 1 FlgK